MATVKDSVSGFVHDCYYGCDSEMHPSSMNAVVIKSGLSDEKVAAYLKWCCVKYAQAVDDYGRSLIHVAASKGRLQLLRFLLTHREANTNAKDFESAYSPVHRSLFYGQLHCAVRLIQGGASLQQTDSDDLTPLDHVMKDRPTILTYDSNQPCEVYIWGMNTNYTLGIGHNHSRSNPDLLDYFRKENISIKQAFLSKFHSLFLGNNGKVWTCGLGSGGRLGLGDESTALVPKVLKISNNSSEVCKSASVGIDHSVLLMENGSVYSFGLNNHHQLGHSPPPEKVLHPRPVKALKGLEIIGVSASKFHTVFWTQQQIFSCGLHGGQLGHLKTNENTISVPKVVSSLKLKSSTIKLVATSNGATVVASSNGEIFLFYEYQVKKITPKGSKLRAKKICVIGGHLDHKVFTSCLQEKGGHELKILILSEMNNIYLWEETYPQMTRCYLSLHRSLSITDIALNRVSVLLTTSDGEAFQGEIKQKKKKTFSEDEKLRSPKSKLAKYVTKDCYYIKLKRIPNIHRAVNVTCDLKGRNFAVVQVHPKMGLLEIPLVETSEMKQNMKTLLDSVDEYDTLHDVVFMVSGVRFPAHRFVVSHGSSVLEELINDSEIIDNVHFVQINNVQPQIFQRVLYYLYTGECDLLEIGICPISYDPKAYVLKDEENANNIITENLPEISAFEHYKQQRSNKKKGECKTESKAKDPIKSLRDAARVFELTNLSKILENLRYENGYISKPNDKKINLPPQVFNRKNLQNLWDIALESENGEIIKAHKCILVARMEYFNCMINQGWLESYLKTPLKLPIRGNVLEILIRYLYTDEAPELVNTNDFDLATHVLVLSDQYFCSKLKEIAEASLANLINLRNAAEMLQLAVTYNANQLKRCAMEFICLNLSSILELQSLEILDDSLLVDLKDFYRSWLPWMKDREIGAHVEVPDDDFIESIYNAEPISLDKVEQETATKRSSKSSRKKSQREKKNSESENQRTRNISVGSVTSDEELFCSLEYSDVEVKEDTWIMVTNHSAKQQKTGQSKSKVTINETISPKTPTLTTAKTPTIPVQKPIPALPVQIKPKSDSFSEQDCSFLSTSSEKEFPALSASAPDRTPVIANLKSPSEISKKFVKLSQKQRKKIANQQKLENEENPKKPQEAVKSVWSIPQYQPPLLSDILKEEAKSSSQSCTLASSPPWQGLSPSGSSLSEIMAAEKQQRDHLLKIKSKSLEYTQMEDKAIDDLMILYDIPNVTDERITVRRAEPVLYSPPVWVSSHR